MKLLEENVGKTLEDMERVTPFLIGLQLLRK
jgi:hypothetical protein